MYLIPSPMLLPRRRVRMPVHSRSIRRRKPARERSKRLVLLPRKACNWKIIYDALSDDGACPEHSEKTAEGRVERRW